MWWRFSVDRAAAGGASFFGSVMAWASARAAKSARSLHLRWYQPGSAAAAHPAPLGALILAEFQDSSSGRVEFSGGGDVFASGGV